VTDKRFAPLIMSANVVLKTHPQTGPILGPASLRFLESLVKGSLGYVPWAMEDN